ncbi:MAG: ATP-binding cassette domain-containing protein [Clostridia bacterium]|nr:ATP-binding cassette domain-containing protein [Clostridia bacterium]
MIELRNVKKIYKDRTVLDVPALCIQDGGSVALAGANGSGKTTLLRILARVLRADSGTITAPDDVLYLPQRPYAFRGSVLDNVLIGAKDRREQALALIGNMELSALADKQAQSLSGGEMQKMALCRLLIRPCALLLLDEPTAALDTEGTELVCRALAQYKARTDCTVVFSTHTPQLTEKAADRLIQLRDGRIETDHGVWPVKE